VSIVSKQMGVGHGALARAPSSAQHDARIGGAATAVLTGDFIVSRDVELCG